MREFWTEGSTDPYCARDSLGRGRVVPTRAVLKSFSLQSCGSDRRNTYPSDPSQVVVALPLLLPAVVEVMRTSSAAAVLSVLLPPPYDE